LQANQPLGIYSISDKSQSLSEYSREASVEISGTSVSLMPSLLDRLIDPDSLGQGAEAKVLTRLIESVRRDLEHLLNTRQNEDPELSQYPELAQSVFAYGMPELISRPAISGPERQRIAQLIRETIRRFEPRIAEVQTILLSPANSLDRQLRFRIEGKLRVEPAPVIEFETLLELSTGQTTVIPEQL
jgi:type VI secretion system protein ImpF